MRARTKIRYWAIVLGLMGYAATSSASDEHYITKDQWITAVETAGVPSEVLYAMSLQESGTTFKGKRDYAPWPWVLNVRTTEIYVEDGVEKSRKVNKGKFFETREQARSFLEKEIRSGNQYVAVGMYQIYLKFNGHYVDDKLSLLEPSVNLQVAAKVLEECGLRFRSMEEKLGCYYSGEYDEEGRAYASNVLQIAQKWGKPYAMRSDEEPRRRGETATLVASVEPMRSARYREFLEKLKSNGPARDIERTIVIGGTTQ